MPVVHASEAVAKLIVQYLVLISWNPLDIYVK